MPQQASTREAYAQALVELGGRATNIVVLDADLAKSTMTCDFAKQFPQCFFDIGLAEQNMMGIAAGLAASGKIVFASTFAIFASARCFDQLRLGIAQPRLNVKIVATHSGITVGEDGFSHHSIEDLALISALPGFTIVVPADAIETAQAVKVAAATPGPFYIRLSRPKTDLVFTEEYQFTLGKAATVRQGKDATIIAMGIMVSTALTAAERLARQGIDCRVVNMSSFKPLDEKAVVEAARETGAIVTAEEHLERGGLGSVVSQVTARNYPVPMSFVAIKDTYAKSGKPEELLKRYNLDVEDIEKAVRSVLKMKRSKPR